MKKALLIAGATAVVVGGGVAAADHYDQYQNKKQATQISQIEQAKRAQYASDQARLKLFVDQATTLKVECAKGEVAYAKLSLAVQKVTPKPVCTSPTAQ